MGKRHIYIHVGAPKTGSSAIQAFLSLNVATLAINDVSYPFPEGKKTITTGVCTGNIIHELQRKATEDGTSTHNRGLLEAYLEETVREALSSTKHTNVVFSSEALSRLTSPKIMDFYRRLADEYNVTFISFFRDVYDQSMSAWKQSIKIGISPRPFATWIEQRIKRGSFDSEHAVELIDAGFDVKLINFDVHRKDLSSIFLREIGLDPALTGFARPTKNISNPSLSYRQAAQVAMAAKHIDSSLFNALLLQRFRAEPDKTPDPYFLEVDKMLMDHLRVSLNEMNNRLPESHKVRTEVRNSPDAGDVAFSLESMASFMEVVRETLATPQAELPAVPQEGLPEDFIPKVYLLLNPDIAEAGVDPIRHYIAHGAFEGRIYKAI